VRRCRHPDFDSVRDYAGILVPSATPARHLERWLPTVGSKSLLRERIKVLRLLPEICLLVLPVALSQGSLAVMYFIDRYFMAKLDTVDVAAAHGGGLASFVAIAPYMGLMSYGMVLVARSYGAGELAACSKTVAQGVLFCLVLSPLVALTALGVTRVFTLFDHPPEQVVLETRYFHLMMFASYLSLFKACLISFFIGIDRPRIVMLSEVLGTAVNVPFAYALIFGRFSFPRMEIDGAGIATIIGVLSSILFLLTAYLQPRNKRKFGIGQSLVFDASIAKSYMRFGTWAGIERLLTIAAFNLYLLLFQSYGVAAGSAAAVALGWDSLCRVPMLALGIAMSGLVGKSIGAQDGGRLRAAIVSGIVLAVGYSALVSIAFVSFRTGMVDLFLPSVEADHPAAALARQLMLGVACYMMADALVLVMAGILRGFSDTRWVMQVSGLLHWVMFCLQYVLVAKLHARPVASFVVFVVMMICLAVVYGCRVARILERHDGLVREGVQAQCS